MASLPTISFRNTGRYFSTLFSVVVWGCDVLGGKARQVLAADNSSKARASQPRAGAARAGPVAVAQGIERGAGEGIVPAQPTGAHFGALHGRPMRAGRGHQHWQQVAAAPAFAAPAGTHLPPTSTPFPPRRTMARRSCRLPSRMPPRRPPCWSPPPSLEEGFWRQTQSTKTPQCSSRSASGASRPAVTPKFGNCTVAAICCLGAARMVEWTCVWRGQTTVAEAEKSRRVDARAGQ